VRVLSVIELRCLTTLTRQVTAFASYTELLRQLLAGYVPTLDRSDELAVALGTTLVDLGFGVEWRG
jgi:hypothetical protein